jgi:hypothetical protein
MSDRAPRQTRQQDFIDNKWRVSYVFEEQNGATVIAGISVTPLHPGLHVGPRGELTGSDWPPEPEAAPPGGLTARILRRVKTGPEVIHRKTQRSHPRLPQTMPPPRRPGPAGRPDTFYLDIAVRIDKATQARSRRPIADVTAQLPGYTREYVRDLVREARRRDLLSQALPGKGGGRLTPRARRLLKKEARRAGR